jgi:uncharacterized protein (DUF2141 family)
VRARTDEARGARGHVAPEVCTQEGFLEVAMRRSPGSVRLLIAIVGSLAALAPLSPGDGVATADAPSIVVEVGGLRSSRGVVRGALFRSRDGWAEEGREIATCEARIHAGRASCVLDDVRPGRYAFAFLHDENEDGALDRDWIGIPQEGFGFSNDAAPGLGPPSFESARFEHQGQSTTLTVRARYGL